MAQAAPDIPSQPGVSGRQPSAAIRALLALGEHDLPCTDDMPMPDSYQQGDAIRYTGAAMRNRYRDCTDVAVEADMFMYYLPPGGAEPRLDGAGRPIYPRLAPDVLVAFGAPMRWDRESYVIAKEGKVPDFVLEVASKSTWRRDYGEKREIYQALGVREYFIFDARERARKRLTGLTLRHGAYEEIAPTRLADGRMSVYSAVLDLHAYANDAGDLRWRDLGAGEDLRTLEESERERQQAWQELEQERRRRVDEMAAKDAEIVALRAALGRRADQAG